jgi:hypothetical protein
VVLTGETAGGHGVILQAKVIATDMRGVLIQDSGHWLVEEAEVIQLVSFLNQGQ